MAGKGVVTTWEIKSRHFEKSVDCVVLKLTVYITNAISFSFKPKTRSGEIQTFRTFFSFLAKFSILVYISLKIGYLQLSHDNDVTVTSYLECWYLFWYL